MKAQLHKNKTTKQMTPEQFGLAGNRERCVSGRATRLDVCTAKSRGGRNTWCSNQLACGQHRSGDQGVTCAPRLIQKCRGNVEREDVSKIISKGLRRVWRFAWRLNKTLKANIFFYKSYARFRQNWLSGSKYSCIFFTNDVEFFFFFQNGEAAAHKLKNTTDTRINTLARICWCKKMLKPYSYIYQNTI